MGSGHFQRERVSGYFPQYGAIFMSDNFTRKECFARKVFGLPSNFSDFVMEVKTGMPLFLFDYQDRNLYGVFEASSDGAMNIVPNAYKSSKKQFPAQVRFSIVWRCDPVPEHVFRDAIEENYFAPHRFNFGLSRDQVQRLLYLFEKRKIMIKNPHSLLQKRKCEIRYQKANSVAKSQPKSLDNSEPLSNWMLEKPATLGVSDVGIATDHNDYIPLPSIDPEEIKNPLPDGSNAVDYIPLPSTDLEENETPLPDGLDTLDYIPLPSIDLEEAVAPLPNVLAGGPCEAFQSNDDSLFSKVGDCLSKGDMCSSVLECDNREEGDKLTNKREEGDRLTGNGSRYHVQGLYSDDSKNRTSAFLRLSGLSRLIKEKESHDDWQMDNSRKILNRLDKSYEAWTKTIAERAPPTKREAKALENRVSVFSRLSLNGRKAPKSERVKVSSGEMKQLSSAENVIAQNVKRKKCSTIKTPPEVEGIIARNEKSDNRLSRNQKKRRRSSSKISQEPKTSDTVLSQGSPACTGNTGSSCDASSKSSIVDDRDSVLS